MKSQTVLQKMQSRFDSLSGLGNKDGDVARRIGHGGSAWSLPRGLNGLRQPQDGAAPADGTSTLLAALRSQTNPFEAEDARITGGTRSLTRRLMGLNVTSVAKKPVVKLAPAIVRRQAA